MQDIYEEMADIMLSTMAGQMAGLTREQFIETFKTKFPEKSEFRALVERTKAQGEMLVTQAQANLPHGHQLAIAVPVDAGVGRRH